MAASTSALVFGGVGVVSVMPALYAESGEVNFAYLGPFPWASRTDYAIGVIHQGPSESRFSLYH
jgi:hypothetical protein